MKKYLILFAAIMGTVALDAATPRKGAAPYDGLRISGASAQMIDWQAVKNDGNVKYVYLDVPVSAVGAAFVKARKTLGLPTDSEADIAVATAAEAADTTLIRNMRAAREAGLGVGLCFSFVDTLSRSFVIRTMLRNIPAGLSTKAPMIDIPASEAQDRSIMHRRLQIWTNALNAAYGSKPVLMATREVCKAYLAPVLSTIYPICLVHPEGPGMRQYPTPYSGPVTALPLWSAPE